MKRMPPLAFNTEHLAGLVKDYITCINGTVLREPTSSDSDALHTNINTSGLAIRDSYLVSVCMFVMSEAPKKPKEVLTGEARRRRRDGTGMF